MAYKQQVFDDDEEGEHEYLQLFRNEVETLIIEEFLGFRGKSHNSGGEIDNSIVSLARVDAWVATAVTCLTEPEHGEVRGRSRMLTDRE